MAIPISEGRMIRKDISRSVGFSKLSPESQLLFCLLIPHFSSHGKMNGNPYFIKGEIVPLLNQFQVKTIEKCLKEITDHTSVKWFEYNGIFYIHSLNWANHQKLREDRLGSDSMPDYSIDSPGLIPPEVEVEVKEEVEVKGKVQGTSGGIPYQEICDKMNQILGTDFRNMGNFQKLVKARINEGFLPEDFEIVCRKKFQEWGSDLKMMQYLRPDTLFSSKMNSYLGSQTGGRPVGDRERINHAAGQAFLEQRERNVWTTETL